MKVTSQWTTGQLQLIASPGQQDTEFMATKKARLARPCASFALPDQFKGDSVHCDALGLLALLVYGVFTARNLELSWAVSLPFAEAVKKNFKRVITPVDAALPARRAPTGSRDALAFSGGVDSVAALALLPDTALPIFMNRVIPEGVGQGLYRADAALASCRDVLNSGRDIDIVDTDMEFVRDPVGFSTDWTNAAGAVLFSDLRALRSVAFGMIQESAFFLGHPHFADLRPRNIYSAWAPLFDAIDLPIALPTAGLSEVVTSRIATSVASKWRAQSCVRGGETTPCGHCFKCFRKQILDARLTGRHLPGSHFEIARFSKEVRRRLLDVPIHHENVLAYSLHGLRSDSNEIYDSLLMKTRPLFNYAHHLTCLEGLNPRGLDYLPAHLIDPVATNIASHVPLISTQDTELINGWDTIALTLTDEYLAGQRRLQSALS